MREIKEVTIKIEESLCEAVLRHLTKKITGGEEDTIYTYSLTFKTKGDLGTIYDESLSPFETDELEEIVNE